MDIRFDGQVAIVTGAGGGLGKSHALELARRGAKVVVNDLGGAKDGTGSSSAAADAVVAEIREAGGEAIANGASVTDRTAVDAMVKQTMDEWGRIDILINNAGILRDKSFGKMPVEDFQLVVDVHLMGTVNCTHAVWNIMKEQEYGRILMTTSSSGMYGNFGQSNYGAAKMGVLGLMNTLVIEGAKSNIQVCALGPCAGTRMTEGLMDPTVFEMLTVERVTAGALALVHRDSPNRVILNAGAGAFSSTRLVESNPVYIGDDKLSVDSVFEALPGIRDFSEETEIQQGGEHVIRMVTEVSKHIGQG